MSLQLPVSGQAEQVMQQSGVPQIDYGGLDESFTEILEPRLKLSNHEGEAEFIEPVTNGFVGQCHEACQF